MSVCKTCIIGKTCGRKDYRDRCALYNDGNRRPDSYTAQEIKQKLQAYLREYAGRPYTCMIVAEIAGIILGETITDDIK